MTAIAIPHPRGHTARIVRPPQTCSDQLLSMDEELMLAQHQEIERLQARIDALMLEYCPDEMTPEQKENWARHQQPVPPNDSGKPTTTA